MGNLTSFPLLAIPVVVYNIIAWGGTAFGDAGADVPARMREVILAVPMVSGAQWILTPGDLLIILALVLLFLELLKSTSTGRQAIINHAFSMVVLLLCFMEFLVFPAFATSVFFMIMVMALLDVLAGFIVTIVTARRDIAVGEDFAG